MVNIVIVVGADRKTSSERLFETESGGDLIDGPERAESIGVAQTEKLAEQVDLTVRNIQKIEAGETNVLVTTAARIRRALGCPSDALIPHDW